MGHGMFGFGFGGGFMMIVFWALFIVGAVMLFRWASGADGERRGEVSSSLSPEEILKQRYASGEIGRDEYDEIRKSL